MVLLFVQKLNDCWTIERLLNDFSYKIKKVLYIRTAWAKLENLENLNEQGDGIRSAVAIYDYCII